MLYKSKKHDKLHKYIKCNYNNSKMHFTYLPYKIKNYACLLYKNKIKKNEKLLNILNAILII